MQLTSITNQSEIGICTLGKELGYLAFETRVGHERAFRLRAITVVSHWDALGGN